VIIQSGGGRVSWNWSLASSPYSPPPAAGSLFTAKSVGAWYAGLKRPPFTPPNWAFGPVWTALYIMMAAAVFLIWRQGLGTAGVLLPFILFWVQLVFNAAWSAVFFGMKSKGGGVVVIALLWLLILATIITSFPVKPAGGHSADSLYRLGYAGKLSEYRHLAH
jgi:tryptophan-rich sensory protein